MGAKWPFSDSVTYCCMRLVTVTVLSMVIASVVPRQCVSIQDSTHHNGGSCETSLEE